MVPAPPGLPVHAWKQEGGWAAAATREDGTYRLAVISGTWEIEAEPPFSSTLVPVGPPQRRFVPDNTVITNVNFLMVEAAGVIQGVVLDKNKKLLTDIEGWAYARRPTIPEPVANAPVVNGQFSLNVPPGSYEVGLWLPPNSDYTVSGEQSVGPLAVTEVVAQAQTSAEVAMANMARTEWSAEVTLAGTTVPVTFTVLSSDAYIVGTFYTDTAKMHPAIGLQGEVSALGGPAGAWRSVPIDPATGSYSLSVAAGIWNLGYFLQSAGYVNNPPPDTRVDIKSGEVFTFNFSIVAADSVIEGRLLKPDSTAYNYGFAWAHRPRTRDSAQIDTGDESQPPDGYFRISVPAGQYRVGGFAPEILGWIQPDSEVVTPTAGIPASVTLQFKESNAVVTGTVYYNDETGNRVFGPDAWVWAWSEDGQHSGAPAGLDGKYRLNLVTGTVWHIGAAYQVEQGSLFYETITPTVLTLTSSTGPVDLDIYLASTALPPALGTTFDPSVGWTGTLSDGTKIEIPAGAMPTTDTVRISVTPLVEELPNTLTARPFGYGYAIVAYENTSGVQITKNFNKNIVITFYYTEAELSRRGVSEDNLSPAYFSTTTNTWTKVESYMVDKTANQVAVQINHFSRWSLTAPAEAAPTSFSLYLPLIRR